MVKENVIDAVTSVKDRDLNLIKIRSWKSRFKVKYA